MVRRLILIELTLANVPGALHRVLSILYRRKVAVVALSGSGPATAPLGRATIVVDVTGRDDVEDMLREIMEGAPVHSVSARELAPRPGT